MSQEIESTPTTFELRCNSTGQIDNVAEVACNPIKCGFKFPDYMQSHVHYTNFTEYYFGYGNKKTFQCEEGYSTYREDFYTAGNHTIDNTVVAECLIDGTTNYTRLDGTSNSVLNCFPVKCAEPVIDKAVWFETLDSGKTSEYKRGVQKSKLIF